MPGYRRGFSRRRGALGLTVVNSMKNVVQASIGVTSAIQDMLIAKAVTSPSPTTTTDVSHGCVIKAIWLSLDFCGLGGTGVLVVISAYLMKNPGDSLTLPSADAVGSSNEKKFVIKQWNQMAMRNQDGNPPYHWEGWIRIPRRYHRMGTDDTWRLGIECTPGVTGHGSIQAIYKWYR